MRIVVILLTTALSVALSTPSLAAAAQVCGGSYGGTAIACGADDSSVAPVNQPAAARPGPSSPGSSGPAKKYVSYDRIMGGPDGQPCIGTGYAEEGRIPRPSFGVTDREQAPGSVSDLYSTAPPCPAQPSQAGQPAPVVTPAMVARRYWEEVPLPKPKPAIAPGRAITGKLAFLETRGEITHTYTNDTAFGPLEILAKGSYVVDWGDGETTGPYDIEGKPWPNGQITHEYVDIGVYDVVVTEKWTATWRLGGQSGVLRTLQTTGTIGAFPVEQLQAVIGR